jgi:hypothetical protein
MLLPALSAAALASADELTPHQAGYKVRIAVISGELKTELRTTEDGYIATHVIKPTGLSRLVTSGKMHVTSTFAAAKDGIRPLNYHAIDSIRDEPEARISFDWISNEASGTVGSDEVTFQLEGIAHDAVSIQYQLMHDLLNDRPGESYVLFDVDKMRIANIRAAGRKTVTTRAGTYEVVGVQHQREGSSRIMTLWCAPELDFLPVIIEQHRKGKLKFRATLSHYAPL